MLCILCAFRKSLVILSLFFSKIYLAPCFGETNLPLNLLGPHFWLLRFDVLVDEPVAHYGINFSFQPVVCCGFDVWVDEPVACCVFDVCVDEPVACCIFDVCVNESVAHCVFDVSVDEPVVCEGFDDWVDEPVAWLLSMG